MKYVLVASILTSLAVGALGGYCYRGSLAKHDEALYPKCFSVGYLQERLNEGWDINTLKTTVDGRKIGVVESAIFDVVCGANPVIDKELASFYLAHGGRLSVQRLQVILKEAKRNDYPDLLKVVEAPFER